MAGYAIKPTAAPLLMAITEAGRSGCQRQHRMRPVTADVTTTSEGGHVVAALALPVRSQRPHRWSEGDLVLTAQRAQRREHGKVAAADDDEPRGAGAGRLVGRVFAEQHLGVLGDERQHGDGEGGVEHRQGGEIGLEGEVFGARPRGSHRDFCAGGVVVGFAARRPRLFGRAPGPVLREARYLGASLGKRRICTPSTSRSRARVT